MCLLWSTETTGYANLELGPLLGPAGGDELRDAVKSLVDFGQSSGCEPHCIRVRFRPGLLGGHVLGTGRGVRRFTNPEKFSWPYRRETARTRTATE